MKTTLLLLTICFGVTVHLFAQENAFKAPDYEIIKKEIADKSSIFYYPNLMDRMVAGDTSLTDEDYRHLYFGYVFDSKYNSVERPAEDEALKQYYQSEKLSENDYDAIIKLCTSAIASHPFGLRQMNFLAYVYHLKGEPILSKQISDRFQRIIKTIIQSGNGKTCETGFHVINIGHEYVFMNTLKIKAIKQSLIGNCDYQEFEKGKYSLPGIYFSIEKILENERKLISGN